MYMCMQFVYAGCLLVILYKLFITYCVYSNRTQAKKNNCLTLVRFSDNHTHPRMPSCILFSINIVLYMQPHTWQRSSDTHFELAHFKKDKKKKGDQPGVTNHISQGQQAHTSGSVCVLYPLLCKVKINLPYSQLFIEKLINNTPKCYSPTNMYMYMYMYFYTRICTCTCMYTHIPYMCTCTSKIRPF